MHNLSADFSAFATFFLLLRDLCKDVKHCRSLFFTRRKAAVGNRYFLKTTAGVWRLHGGAPVLIALLEAL